MTEIYDDFVNSKVDAQSGLALPSADAQGALKSIRGGKPCPICGEVSNNNFCPHCGAPMENDVQTIREFRKVAEWRDVDAQKARIVEAREKTSEQFYALADKCREVGIEDSAILYETYAIFCDDDDFVEEIESILTDEGCNAEYAVKEGGKRFAAMFAAMDDAYMRARSDDVTEVTQRILDNLSGAPMYNDDDAIDW